MESFSECSLRTLAIFGLTVSDVGLDKGACRLAVRRAACLGRRVEQCLSAGRVGVVLGPSGAGKSTLLRGVAAAARAGKSGERVVWARALPARMERMRAVEVALESVGRAGGHEGGGDGLEAALRLLGRCGLADARLAVTRACAMSEGERVRLALARAVARCGEGRSLLIIDEFGASLDDTGAATLGANIALLAARSGRMRVLIATHREGVVGAVNPVLVARVRAGWMVRAAA